jgi:hypothetical protein
MRKRASQKHEKAPYTGPVLVDPLESLIRQAIAAKKAGRWFQLPSDISASDCTRIWSVAMRRIRSELATGGAP